MDIYTSVMISDVDNEHIKFKVKKHNNILTIAWKKARDFFEQLHVIIEWSIIFHRIYVVVRFPMDLGRMRHKYITSNCNTSLLQGTRYVH